MIPSLAELIHAEYLLSRIPAHIRDALAPDQRQEVLNAFLEIALERNSPLKFEATLPFFFRRYYLLIWFGRDRRKTTAITEEVRRNKVPLPIRLVMYFAVIWFIATSFSLLTFVAMYVVKSSLGIDIFPNEHLRDFVEVVLNWLT